MALSEGQVIAGRFRATRVLGAGGMGEVWAADSLRDGREVALKILSAASRTHAEVVTRFRREAFLLGRIKSSHVARIVEFIDDPTVGPVLVMELIAGRSLLSMLEERKLHIEEAVFLARDLARALCDLHAVNIVHRDLKPGNIIMRPDGEGGPPRAVVVDFGIGRQLASEGEEITGITRANIALGTVEYMAPEQILDSREVTPLADIYACGAILFRAVAGHHVYGSRRDQELARAKLLEDPPRLPVGQNEIARGFADVVNRCLARKPKQRLASAKQLLVAVQHLEERVRVSMLDLDSTTTQDSAEDSGPRTLVERDVKVPDDRLATARRASTSQGEPRSPAPPHATQQPPSGQSKAVSSGRPEARRPAVQTVPTGIPSPNVDARRPSTRPPDPATAHAQTQPSHALQSHAPHPQHAHPSPPRSSSPDPRDGGPAMPPRGTLPSFQELSSAAAAHGHVRGSLPSIPESQPRFHSTADIPALSRPHAAPLERRRGVSRSTFGLGLLLALSGGAAGGFVLAESQHKSEPATRASSAAAPVAECPSVPASAAACAACPEAAPCGDPPPSGTAVALGQDLPLPNKTAAPPRPVPPPPGGSARVQASAPPPPAATAVPTGKPTGVMPPDLDTLER